MTMLYTYTVYYTLVIPNVRKKESPMHYEWQKKSPWPLQSWETRSQCTILLSPLIVHFVPFSLSRVDSHFRAVLLCLNPSHFCGFQSCLVINAGCKLIISFYYENFQLFPKMLTKFSKVVEMIQLYYFLNAMKTEPILELYMVGSSAAPHAIDSLPCQLHMYGLNMVLLM